MILYTELIMSPVGIQRTVAFIIILSPWIFIPGLFKDVIFVVSGILLFISSLDLRKKSHIHHEHHENESIPVTEKINNA